MKILYLGPRRPGFESALRARGHRVTQRTQRFLTAKGFDWIVSWGYRHKLAKKVIADVKGNAINLHISYLPWNRGADPNFWSWADDTPKGVSIHWMDEHLDTGPVIAQKECVLSKLGTLKTSYDVLQDEVGRLFWTVWQKLEKGERPKGRKMKGGSTHKTEDRLRYWGYFPDGWDTKVNEVENIVAQTQMSEDFV